MKYIFLDIDGTLYDHKNQRIPESAYLAIRMAKARGHKIFICTGRPYCMLSHVKGIGYEGVIAAAGAYVEVNQKAVYEDYLEPEELKALSESCESLGISYILEGKNGVYMHPVIREYYLTGKGKKTGGHEFFKQKQVHGLEKYDEKEDIIYKISIYTEDREALPAFEKQLSPKYHLISAFQEKNHPFCAELTLKKNNKASGIRAALEYLGGDMKDTVAVGDSLNDLEMMEECAVSIAMGNADERMKPYADYITSDIDKDGIYRAFEQYHLI